MVVPFGSSEVYYDTNSIAFSALGIGDKHITFDMATTIHAWGKVLDARSRHAEIPDTWGVDENGKSTIAPFWQIYDCSLLANMSARCITI